MLKSLVQVENCKIQLPIAFPIIKSECPFIEDVIVIKISGNDVPIATTVNPIIVSDKPNFLLYLQQTLIKSLLLSLVKQNL